MPDVLSALGISFARHKMYPQAVTAFNQSLVLNSQSPITHSNIGLAYYLQDKVEKFRPTLAHRVAARPLLCR